VAALVTAGPEPAILFIQRRERVGDPWSGQMALPGGFVSPSDDSLETTARRETEEETGIALAKAGVLLGVLDDVSPRTPYLPPLVVTPYVFLVPGELAAHAGPEAEAAVWLRVRDLFDPGLRRPFRLRFSGEVKEFESIVVEGYTIWGLTERVLQQLGEAAGTQAP
jgi:ADP-ribose pyrophosphatase YjhB (NUDIX family)